MSPIAELCPAIDHVIAVNRVAMRDGPIWRALWDMAGLIRRIKRERFDLVIDFHSFRETNLLTWLSRAPVRMGMKRDKAAYLRFCFNRQPVLEDKSLHVADMFQRVVDAVPGGKVTAPPAVSPQPTLLKKEGKRSGIALFVDAPVPERIWPGERFAEVADFAIEKLGTSVVVISSKERTDLARQVQSTSRNPDKIAIFTDLALPVLVSVIASSYLLVSNDTGPMHIGPAVGVPTLGLFSVGYPEHFRPIGPEDRFLRANPIEGIKTKDVIQAVEQIWLTIVGPDLRR